MNLGTDELIYAIGTFVAGVVTEVLRKLLKRKLEKHGIKTNQD